MKKSAAFLAAALVTGCALTSPFAGVNYGKANAADA